MIPNNNTPQDIAIIHEALSIKPQKILQIVGHNLSTLNKISTEIWQQTQGIKAYIPDHAADTLNPSRSIYHHFIDIAPISLEDLYLLCQRFLFPKDKLHQKPDSLSQGQAQLVAIMLAWHQNPDILIANQPFFSLDSAKKENLIDLFNQKKATLILLNTFPVDRLHTDNILYCEDLSKQHTFFLKRPKSTNPLIVLEQVSLQYVSTPPITLHLYQEITGLIGPNGCGKTTLAKTIMHELPHSGQIYIQGQCFSPRSLYQKRYLQFMFQKASQSFHPDYPLSHLLLEPRLNTTLLFEILEQFPPIEDWEKSYPNEVSLSTLKTLCFARIIARTPSFIILDEPLSGMNTEWIQAFFKILLSLKIGVLIIDHDTEALKTICNEIYTLQGGVLHVL